MLFKPELIEQIKTGRKTQTRRVVKPHEQLIGCMPGTRFHQCVAQTLIIGDRTVPHRIKWQVGKSYAICPGRTLKSVGRIHVLSLRLDEDVRQISTADAQAEAFLSTRDFLSTWIHLNDRTANACWDFPAQRWIWYTARRWHHSNRGDDWQAYLASRPADRYRAWVIEFEYEESR